MKSDIRKVIEQILQCTEYTNFFIDKRVNGYYRMKVCVPICRLNKGTKEALLTLPHVINVGIVDHSSTTHLRTYFDGVTIIFDKKPSLIKFKPEKVHVVYEEPEIKYTREQIELLVKFTNFIDKKGRVLSNMERLLNEFITL